MHQDAGEPGAPPRLLLVGERAWLETPRSAFGDDATFVTATTTESALEELDGARPTPDCVVVGDRLGDADAAAFVSNLRERDVRLPVVVAPGDGSERLAADVVAAGADGYVSSVDVAEALPDRVRGAIADARDRRRAAQFEALFSDSGTYRWVLEADGRVVEVNDAARERFSIPDGLLWEASAFDGSATRELRGTLDDAHTGDPDGLSVEPRSATSSGCRTSTAGSGRARASTRSSRRRW